MSGDVRTKMGAERPAPLALHQDLDIPSCLSRLDYAERIFLVPHLLPRWGSRGAVSFEAIDIIAWQPGLD